MTPNAPVRERASDQIFALLRDRICSGELLPGARLPTERDLAELYSVSINTIREAIRGLTLMGLVEVRHGSGAYVSGDASRFVDTSLGLLLRFEDVGLADVVRLAGVLHRHVATLAVERATAQDIENLEEAITEISSADPEHLGARIQDFLRAFAATAHEPLLEALCYTIDRLVVTITHDVFEPDFSPILREIEALLPVRLRLLRALTERSATDLTAAWNEYESASQQLILGHPSLNLARLSDPRWAAVLSTLA